MFSVFRGCLLGLLLTLCLTTPTQAQWQTQSIALKNGWNGVFLHITPQTNAITDVLNNFSDIEEIWLWKPNVSSSQFVTNPEEPTDTGSRWLSWKRSESGSSELQTLLGNAAYLFRCSAPTTLALKGKPAPPNYLWSSSGLNFIGLPSPPTGASNLDAFLSPAPGGVAGFEIYDYDGAANPIPAREYALATRTANRGEAFWFRSDEFNRYFGPLEIVLPDVTHGVAFNDFVGRHRVIVRNRTAQEINFSMQLVASETPPAGQTPIVGQPPVLVRGALNSANLTYSAFSLPAQTDQKMSWNLKERNTDGSAVELVLGIGRHSMTGNAGDLYAGILRFTDSLGHTQIDVPVSAIKESLQGLWVGDAVVTEVRHNLLQKPIAASSGN